MHPFLPVKSVRQLVALAKARPGELNYSTGAPGSSNYPAAMLFSYMATVKSEMATIGKVLKAAGINPP